ncbi:hypothetical protein [Anaeromyxobacter terrae]|uniref:hypothetical protein n=1 Tax=Anaeromyxobacter terrae TaxID=2925406 RepID=UPI001F5972AF|nr:hypothetical protein [Anaeromyxobacter sp. SG22]
MMKTLLAAMAALVLVAARPVSACDGDCKNCPHHAQAAAGEAKKDGEATPAAPCACAKEGKECKCGEKCKCPHCAAAHKVEGKKAPEKKS